MRDWKFGGFIRFYMILILFPSWVTQIGIVNAEPVKRLPDGKVLLTVFEQKLAIPEGDTHWVDFWGNRCTRVKQGWLTYSHLSDAVENLGVADCVGQVITEEKYLMLNLSVDKRAERPLFLGALPIEERLRYSTVELSFGRGNSGIPKNAPMSDPSKSESFRTNLMTQDKLGFRIYPGIPQYKTSSLRDTKYDPMETAYVLEASRRRIKTIRPLVIICRWGGNANRSCYTWLTAGTNQLSLYVEWYEPNIPRQEWRDVDVFMTKIYDAIAVNKPYGELQ